MTSLFARAQFTRRRIASLAFVAILALAAVAARAQDPNKPPPPPPAQPPTQAAPPSPNESSSKSQSGGLGAAGLGAPPPPPRAAGLPGGAEPLPPFDPLNAMKDVEIGTFYLKNGKYDAAIDRFMDATHAQPTYALPWELMGQAYEKKGDFGESVKAYQKYLKLYPHAPDRKKIEEHIAELQKKQQLEAQKNSGK